MLQSTFLPAANNGPLDRSAGEAFQSTRAGDNRPGTSRRGFASLFKDMAPSSPPLPDRRSSDSVQNMTAQRTPVTVSRQPNNAMSSSRVSSSATRDSRPARPVATNSPNQQTDASRSLPDNQDLQSDKTKADDPASMTSSPDTTAPRPNKELHAENELQPNQKESSPEDPAATESSPGLVENLYICVAASLIPNMPVPSADTTSSPAGKPLSDGSTMQTVDATGQQPTQLVDAQPNAGPPVPVPVQSGKPGTAPQHQALPAATAPQLVMAALGGREGTTIPILADAGALDKGSSDASVSSSNGKPLEQGSATGGPIQPASSNETLLQNLKRVIDPILPSDPAPIDGSGEQRTQSDAGHFDMLRDSSLGTADDRKGAEHSELSQAGSSALHGQSRFGEAVTAQIVEPAATMDGSSSHKSAAPSSTGRAAGAPSWFSEPGQAPVIHSVSLDLEPADLGPVNVRIFMMDRTVHAHIRTEHFDLGQGMVGQQQQLETKLQHSGLEMGEFKVTVDQHQLPRHDSQGWLGQSGTWRPAMEASQPRESGRETSEVATIERPRRSGIVSFFA